MLGPVQTKFKLSVCSIDRLEIGTNARSCLPNATMFFLRFCVLCYYFSSFLADCIFSHLFGIFAGSNNAATVQIAGDNDNNNSNSDTESCSES